jgi:hypothetical protein
MAVLLWSGGCDSTLLLADMLKAKKGGKPGEFVTLDDNDHVRAFSVVNSQQAGYAQNLKARQRLAPTLKRRFGEFVHAEMRVRHKGLFIDSNGGMPQPMMWLLHAVQILDSSEDLYVGYIKGDEVWHYRAQLELAFQYVQQFTHRTGKLRMPLEWVSKAEVLAALRRLKLLKHTWHCELPVRGRTCRTCASCVAHLTAKWQLGKFKPKVETQCQGSSTK